MVLMYRNSQQITEEILSSITEAGQEGVIITKIMRKSNLPYSRMNIFIKKLIGGELINKIETKGKVTFIITDKGRIYLDEYRKFSNIAESFGLDM